MDKGVSMTAHYNQFKIEGRRGTIRICRAEVSTGSKPVNDRKEKTMYSYF
jgi:hypothetical protein